MSKRTRRGIWLVGSTTDFIAGLKLPSKRQVLSRFLTLHNYNDKLPINVSAKITTKEVLPLWEKARIPVQQEYNVVKKVKKLFEAWKTLQKSSKRQTDDQKKAVETFCEDLDNLFDIAHANALRSMKIEEDRNFLIAQRRKGRHGALGAIDKKFAIQEKNRQKRNEVLEARRDKARRESSSVQKMVELESDSSNDGNCNQDQSSDDFFVNKMTKQRMRGPKRPKLENIVDLKVVSASDRTNVSNRKATYILAAAAESMGQDLNRMTMSTSSIRRARMKHRKQLAEEIEKSFPPEIPLTIHWDGKLLPDITGKENVERLAILVSGEGITKLLGVPLLVNSTGKSQANAVLEALNDWILTDRISFMCLDTTASNTGTVKGACSLIEKNLDKNLGSLACRHHIFELVAAKVFDTVYGPSSGPNILIFKRFSESWKNIDKTVFESGIQEETIASKLKSDRTEIINFVKHQLTVFHPRDDYTELLQLVLLFLGDKSLPKISIRAPGALHRARWMARIIYALKIFLFRSQFRLTSHEFSALQRFNIFIVKCYVKAWYTSQCAAAAPQNDLNFLKLLYEFRKTDDTVSEAAIHTFGNHLRYLSEVLVGLSFFDDNVPEKMKLRMSEALHTESDKKVTKKAKFNAKIHRKEVSDFVTENTRLFFDLIRIEDSFSTKHPNEWEKDSNYVKGKKIVQHLSVVNDVAERGIALITQFNSSLVNNEEQKQYLLQTVENHRKQFSEPRKKDI